MMNQFALHVRKSSFVRINRHPWLRGWGWGGQRRDVYLAMAHPYLPVPRDALKTALHLSAQTPGQVAGGLVIFLAVPESLGSKEAYLSLLWACHATKKGMAGTVCTDWLTLAHPLRL